MTKKSGRTKSILDRSFRYTPSTETDLRKTFARIRREQRLRERAGSHAHGEVRLTTCPTYPGFYSAEIRRLAPEGSW